jgi:hypothetical protein
MAGFFILLALLLGGAAFLFKEAGDEISVGGWASDLCTTSKLFCQHPEYLAYAGGVILVLAVGFKLGSIAR